MFPPGQPGPGGRSGQQALNPAVSRSRRASPDFRRLPAAGRNQPERRIGAGTAADRPNTATCVFITCIRDHVAIRISYARRAGSSLVDIAPIDADLADRAISGWRRYGKGGHPAGLNFGDVPRFVPA
jgi:uncharacterized protein with PIN domain